VNGQRVAGSASLGHADLIQLGDYRIFLTNEERALAPPSASGRPAASMPPTPEYPDRLVVLAGPEPGFECRLDRGVVTIGRSEECTFAINHPSVSRVHAVVHPVAPGRFEILDKDSANGLRINGVDMRRKILEGGDIIEFGDVQMRYFEQGQAPPITSDVSQRVRSIPAPSSLPPAHPHNQTQAIPRGRAGRWGAIALAVLAVGVGVAALQSRPRTPSGPGTPIASAPPIVADDASNAQLERARAVVHADPAEALRIIAAMPDGPRRRAADVGDLADQAANAILGNAAREADPARRQPMLAPLQSHPLVSDERRRQAKDLLKPIPDPVAPPPVSPTNSVIDPTAPRPSGGKERPGPGGTRAAPDEGAGGDAVDPTRPPTARAGGRDRVETRDREGAAVRPAPRPREGREETVDTSQAI
ncbi:MAG TPA: FHA domain-containing protein, partial [Polyangiaceae bacterium]|nr:FHA domain-containing protein [Polyangiaceae bacterium]